MRIRVHGATRLLGLVCAVVVGAGGCSGGGSRAGGAGMRASGTDRSGVRIVVVTHGQSSDPFWSVVSNGVRDAAADLGVKAVYQAPTSFDMVRMSELIDAAVASRPSGLVVSIPDA